MLGAFCHSAGVSNTDYRRPILAAARHRIEPGLNETMLDASGVPGPRLLRHVQYVRPVDRPGACFGVSVIETIDLRASVIRTIQRYVNFHSSVTVDLFGSDLSSNAATFYTT